MRYILVTQYRRIKSSRPRFTPEKIRKPAVEIRPEVIPARKNKSQRREINIRPIVRERYNRWLDQYRRDKLSGRKRKMLPIGALERYYDSRLHAYEALGYDPALFADAFDKVDIQSVSDSWQDLDPELKKVGLPSEIISQKDKFNQLAEEHREYRQYLQDLKEDQPKEYEKYLASKSAS